jgi:hypothetical protein
MVKSSLTSRRAGSSRRVAVEIEIGRRLRTETLAGGAASATGVVPRVSLRKQSKQFRVCNK